MGVCDDFEVTKFREEESVSIIGCFVHQDCPGGESSHLQRDRWFPDNDS